MTLQLSNIQWAGIALGGSVLLLGLWAPFTLLPAPMQHALGIVVCALVLWMTEPVPIELSSLWILLLLPAVGLLDFSQSFAPFAGKTVWLIFAGMALSLGLTATGLGDALAAWTQNRLSTRPFWLLAQLHLVGLVAAFLVPSGVVRVLLLMPIGIALIARMPQPASDTLRGAILLSLLCSTYFGGCGLLTGSVPNLVWAGQYEQAQQTPVFWSTWFYWMFPIIGLCRVFVSLAIIWVLFGRHLQAPDIIITDKKSPTVLTTSQKRAFWILVLGVVLWSTDVFHHIQPVYVGLFLALLFIAPQWGPLPFADLAKIRFPFLFYIAALFSLGTCLSAAGFNSFFIQAASQHVDLASLGWFGRHLAITLLALPLDFLMDIGAVAGVATIPLMELGALHGMAPISTAFSVAMATTLAFLPYQSAPFMVAYGFRQFSLGQLIAAQSLISAFSLCVLCPLNILYWHYLGLI